MSDDRTFLIGELAEAAGVTPRTIRYYTAEGLLPRPDSHGQYALYREEHLLRLRLIARLKEAYLPLNEIKARIDPLDGDQVRALLAQESQPPAPALSSAADYLAQVLNQPQAQRQLAEARARYQPGAEPALADRASPAMQLPGMAATPAAPLPSSQTYGFAQPVAPNQASSSKLAPESPAADTPAASEEQWRRVQLAPGVELHLRDPLGAALRQRVDQLIVLARRLLRGE